MWVSNKIGVYCRVVRHIDAWDLCCELETAHAYGDLGDVLVPGKDKQGTRDWWVQEVARTIVCDAQLGIIQPGHIHGTSVQHLLWF